MRDKVAGATGDPLTWLMITPCLRSRNLCDWSCASFGYPVCERTHVSPGKVWLQVKLPADRLLVSNFELWRDYVMQYAYLPENRRDADRWRRRVVQALGLPSSATLPTLDARWNRELLDEMTESWQRVFNVRPGTPTQAAVESLVLDDLVDFVYGPDPDTVAEEFRADRCTYRNEE